MYQDIFIFYRTITRKTLEIYKNNVIINNKSLRPFGQRLLSFVCGYAILLLGVVDKRQAVVPSGPTLCGQGRFLVLLTASPDCIGKEDLAMVTFSDLIQTGILIVGIIGLVLQIIEIERNHRQ